MILTTGLSPGAGQLSPLVVRPCLCSLSTTQHIGAQDEASSCSSFSVLLHAFASHTAIRGCLECKIAGAGVSPESLINAPLWVVGRAPSTDLACRSRRRWRSSRMPTSLGSKQSLLPYSATAWTQATWTAVTLSGTTPYVFVRVRSLASAALASFIHRLWCSINVRCASIQTPSQCVAGLLNLMNLFPTFIFAGGFGSRCFLWPCLGANSAVCISAVSNCSRRLLSHSMLFTAHLWRIVRTWMTSLPITTLSRSAPNDGPSAETYSSTRLIRSEV